MVKLSSSRCGGEIEYTIPLESLSVGEMATLLEKKACGDALAIEAVSRSSDRASVMAMTRANGIKQRRGMDPRSLPPLAHVVSIGGFLRRST